jgi:hypothetical protein
MIIKVVLLYKNFADEAIAYIFNMPAFVKLRRAVFATSLVFRLPDLAKPSCGVSQP